MLEVPGGLAAPVVRRSRGRRGAPPARRRLRCGRRPSSSSPPRARARTPRAPSAAAGAGRGARRSRGSGRSRRAAGRPCSARAARWRAPCRRDRASRTCRRRSRPVVPGGRARRREELVPALEAARLLHDLRLHRDLVALAQVAEPHDALALVARLRRIARRPLGLVHDRRDEPERVDGRVGRGPAIAAPVGKRDRDDLTCVGIGGRGRLVGCVALARRERRG